MSNETLGVGQLICNSTTPPPDRGFFKVDDTTTGHVGTLKVFDPTTNAQSSVVTATPSDTGAVFQAGGVPISTYPTLQFPIRRVRVGSFGDSISDIGTVANVTAQDIGLASAMATSVGLSSEKWAQWVQFFSGGAIYPVYNGGIGGQTTTQIASRAAGAESTNSTSKSLLNAQLFGAEALVYTGSINDFWNTVTAESTPSQIATIIAIALGNTKTIFAKAKSLGIRMVFHSVMPYGISPVTADQAAVNAATAQYNAQVVAWLTAAPWMGDYWDGRTAAQAADGGWNPAYTADGTHPNHAFYAQYASGLCDLIMVRMGVSRSRVAFPRAKNIFSNADLSAAAAGLATGITVAANDGPLVPTVVDDNGLKKQQFVWTLGNATGTDSSLIVDIELNAAGASPNVPLAIGDVVALEFDLLIDNGNGGAPAIYTPNIYLRKFAGATPTIINSPFSLFAGATTQYYVTPISGRVSGGALVIDEATGASSGKLSCRLGFQGRTQGATVRVQIYNVRAVKLPAGF